MRQRSGADARRWPCSSWEGWPLSSLLLEVRLAKPAAYAGYRQKLSQRFFFTGGDRAKFQVLFSRLDLCGTSPVAVADRIVRGEFRFFEHSWVTCGSPPDWHRNYVTRQTTPKGLHWSRIGEFGYGDIKVVWELSRFGWVYPLVRAFWRTGNESYAECFWWLLEDWRKHNPPQQGVNWKCGQEASFRVMAWCFGLYGFAGAASTTPGRVAMLAQVLAVTGERIEGNLGYALSQQNNHGISEAAGLWTLGLLFPEFRRAGKWLALSRKALERQARELVYDDGSFSQHSANYHRVMLHDYLWAVRLGDLNGQPLSEDLRCRVGRAAEFLFQVQDVTSGKVPLYGSNDGALVLPLSNCDYQDFRPVVQSARFICSKVRTFSPGPWDEELLWLAGPEAMDAPPAAAPPTDLAADDGGCYTLRQSRGFAFIHCPRFKHRPSQADALHVDVWWRGENIAGDAGTYSYNAPVPWDNALAGTACHNTVLVDDKNQMERAGKFLWLPWLRAGKRSQGRSATGPLRYWEGEHHGYSRLSPPVLHRRAVLGIAEDHWLVLDRLESTGKHRYRLHWLLGNYPAASSEPECSLKLDTPQGPYHLSVSAPGLPCQYSLVRSGETSPRGWRAPYYLDREPALSWALEAEGDSCWFYSLFGPGRCSVEWKGNLISVTGEHWAAEAKLCECPDARLVESLALKGSSRDLLPVI